MLFQSDRLDESVRVMRRLLDGERFDHEGPIYPMHDALAAPRPVQPHLPIMIGGSGPKKTLRTLARYGDMWNAHGTPDELREKDRHLRQRFAELGRDPESVERTVSVDMIIRDTRAAALDVYRTIAAGSGQDFDDSAPYMGSPGEIADSLWPTIELGFRHLIIDLPAPYDEETLDRFGEVLERLNA